jgi:hypothetical protein
VHFFTLQPDGPFPFHEEAGPDFCRNVMIYFEKNTQAAVVEKFHQALKPGGICSSGIRRACATTASLQIRQTGDVPEIGAGRMQVVVGVADMKVSNRPEEVLVTHALGSCIGVAIYDPEAKVGGLLHFMLPDSSLDPVKGPWKIRVCLRTPASRASSGSATRWGRKIPPPGEGGRRQPGVGR